MTDSIDLNPIDQFEKDCADAGVAPEDAVVEGGLHRSTWFRWKANAASPTLRSLNAARTGLRKLAELRRAA